MINTFFTHFGGLLKSFIYTGKYILVSIFEYTINTFSSFLALWKKNNLKNKEIGTLIQAYRMSVGQTFEDLSIYMWLHSRDQ